MGSAANITSLEELEHFHAALVQFVDAADDSLLAVDMELRRFEEWLKHEHPRALHQAYLASQEEGAQARNALNRKRLSQVGDRKPDTTEEEEAVRRVKRKIEYLEERIAQTKKWGRLIDRAIDDYRGQARQLAGMLEGDPAPVIAYFRRILASVRDYLSVEVPLTRSADSPPSMAMPSAAPAGTDASAEEKRSTPTGDEEDDST